MRTRLWRCSPEQLRVAHPTEELGYHLAHDSGMGELLRQVISGAPFAVNVAREGPPDESSAAAPMDRSEEGVMLPNPPRPSEGPQSAPQDRVPVNPGLLLPGEPPFSTSSPLTGTPEEPDEGEPSLEPFEAAAASSHELPERPSKVPRTEDRESTRAPGTPVQTLMRGVHAARGGHSGSQEDSASSLRPGEVVPAHGRVERQVREWEQVMSDRAGDNDPSQAPRWMEICCSSSRKSSGPVPWSLSQEDLGQ